MENLLSGDYLCSVDAGRINFPYRLKGIFDRQPPLFYNRKDGCLTLDLGQSKIPSSFEPRDYSFRNGRLFLSESIWLETIGRRNAVVIAGVGDYIEIWGEEKWELEQQKIAKLREVSEPGYS